MTNEEHLESYIKSLLEMLEEKEKEIRNWATISGAFLTSSIILVITLIAYL